MRTQLLLGVAALSLAACKLDRAPTAQQPVNFSAAAPFDLGLAPGYDALPAASQPIPVYYAPQPVAQDYWNNAYSQGQSYYDQPPSYFPYNGATPLVWNQGDMITRIVEALVGGGQREYYYQPGASYPYFVRDPQYAYAYNDGRLIAAYDPYGRPLAETLLMERAPIAGRYLVRAQTLYDVARRTSPRPLTQKVWTVERTRLARQVEDKPWKTWWTPGDNRSPVAVQRLAEVRQRKLQRDLAHTEWMKEKTGAREDRQKAKSAEQHPQFRAEAAPPGKRVHALVPPAERRVEPAKKAEVRKAPARVIREEGRDAMRPAKAERAVKHESPKAMRVAAQARHEARKAPAAHVQKASGPAKGADRHGKKRG